MRTKTLPEQLRATLMFGVRLVYYQSLNFNKILNLIIFTTIRHAAPRCFGERS